jgi:hypothetical protein
LEGGENGGARVLGGDGCKGLRRKMAREGRGRQPRPRGNGGAAAQRGGIRGRAARVKGRLMGQIKVQGPTRPRDSSRPRHKQLTKEILLSYI